jgi:hypothetical protein
MCKSCNSAGPNEDAARIALPSRFQPAIITLAEIPLALMLKFPAEFSNTS